MKTLPAFALMENPIQNYAWGSVDAIQNLFDMPNPSQEPQAEIWMGAHPNGCSILNLNGENIRLDEWIKTAPEAILNPNTYQNFKSLPYLFKVLAANNALSVQVHPSKAAAVEGFAKENQAGIDLKAPNRNYRDDNHKPELVFAITHYQAMNGFREYADIIALFEAVNAPVLAERVAALKANQNQDGLTEFFTQMLSLDDATKEQALTYLLDYAKANQDTELGALLLSLNEQYPNDVGLFTPLMLHVLTLKPGEAMYLDACTPHAYIKGTGLEIMANSDNVLRAGLTPKYMDVPELVKNTICRPKPSETLLLAPQVESNAQHYAIPVPDFNFSVYTGNANIECESAEIIFAIDADVTLTHESGATLSFKKGQSAFIPFASKAYQVQSSGRYARAYN